MDIANDLIVGADEIALFLFGDRSKRRTVYHLAETSNMPFHKMGSKLSLRKSSYLSWVEEQEQANKNRG